MALSGSWYIILIYTLPVTVVTHLRFTTVGTYIYSDIAISLGLTKIRDRECDKSLDRYSHIG